MKIFLSVLGLVSIAGAVSLAIQSFGTSSSPLFPLAFRVLTHSFIVIAVVGFIAPPPPKTLTKEWQEASNERAIEQKMNPITGTFLPPSYHSLRFLAPPGSMANFVLPQPPPLPGISSEGYKGKGFVTHK